MNPSASLSEPHVHWVETRTGIALDHDHELDLFTFPAAGTNRDGHVHRFHGVTRLCRRCDRHVHLVSGFTGPAIPLPDGSHYHEIKAKTGSAPILPYAGVYQLMDSIPSHVHSFTGRTSRETGLPPADW